MPAAGKASSGSTKPDVARKRAPRRTQLSKALAEASWVEADRALARAIVAFEEWRDAPSAAAREDAAALLGQALAQAGRRRGFSRIGEVGVGEPFDPQRHELAGQSKRAPALAYVRLPGVARGEQVLVKARAAPASAKKPT